MFIDNKKIVLLNHLNEDIEKVSETLGISERTIRYRIEDLNEFFIDEKIDYKIVIESRIIKGFGNLEEVIKELEDKNYNFSKSERLEIIFLFLLISSNGCIADEICYLVDISRSTFKIDMRFIRQELEKKKLKVISKANKGLIILGNEIIIRKLLLEKLKKIFEIENKKLKFFEKISSYEVNIIKNYISSQNIQIVTQYLEKLKIVLNKKISDEAYQILMIYLLIVIKRLENNLTLEKNLQNQEFIKSTYDFEIVKSNIFILEDNENIKMNELEIIKITEFLLGAHTYNFKYSFYENWIYIEKMADDLIKKVSEKINLNILKDNTLRDGLINHLIPTIYRLKNDIELENSIHREIIEQYPILYNEVKTALKKIENFIGKEFSENETSFFVVHFVLSIKRMAEKSEEKKKILIVCGLGYGTSNLLKQEMEELFDIEIKDLVPLNNLKNIDTREIDFIITTTDIKKLEVNIPIVKVNSILTKENITDLLTVGIKNRKNRINISEIMEIIKKYSNIEDEEELEKILAGYFENIENKEIEKFIDLSLKDILPLKNIKITKNAVTWKAAIFEAGKILYDNGYIKEKYIFEMIEKIKELGLYMMIGEAIILPHADIGENVIKTGISYLQLIEPIKIGDEMEIKHIFALASCDKNEHIKGLLELKKNIDENNLKEILEKCSTSEEIFNIIENISK